MTDRVLVFGAGEIGSYLTHILAKSQFFKESSIILVDPVIEKGRVFMDRYNNVSFKTVFKPSGGDTVINCLPRGTEFSALRKASIERKCPYFDLTEDITVPESSLGAPYVPNCGVAPGLVNIEASHLLKQFTTPESCILYVGGNPRFAYPPLYYSLTWSPEGLVSLYTSRALYLANGRIQEADPASDPYEVNFDGTKYVAFRTSGGLGTLLDTWGPKLKNLEYRTLRLPEHIAKLRELLQCPTPDEWRQLCPYTKEDILTVNIQATGIINGQRVARSYHKTFIGDGDHSAMQRVTASSLAAAVIAVITMDRTGYIRQEEIDYQLYYEALFALPKLYLNND